MYQHITEHCLVDEHIQKFENIVEKTSPILTTLSEQKDNGALPLLSKLGDKDDIKHIQDIATDIRANFSHLVIMGTGGSSLTGQALVGLGGNNDVTLHFLDNIDPHTFENLFASLPLDKTFFLTISKSGRTVETMAQLCACLDRLSKNNIPNQCLIITDPGSRIVRDIANTYTIKVIDHDPAIGGRFSIFTNVGLIPAAVAGLDIDNICNGGQKALDKGLAANSAPAIGAAIHTVLMKEYSCNVFMPYIDRLAPFANWYKQIWAESLAKGGAGTTALRAVGSLDQHSQLQLYLDGPKDKFFTFVTLQTANKGPSIDITHSDLSHITAKTLGDIMEAEHHATKQALINRGCPVRELRLQQLDEETIGQLAMHFMLETIIVANLINVNAFDQPAVEEIKTLANDLLKQQQKSAA